MVVEVERVFRERTGRMSGNRRRVCDGAQRRGRAPEKYQGTRLWQRNLSAFDMASNEAKRK